MERGHIAIRENSAHEWIVEAKLIDRTLWLTKHEIADLFGVYVSTIGNNLRAILRSGILHEQDVMRVHVYEQGGKTHYLHLYNLEALIFVSYRIASFQAHAFREWVMNALCDYNRTDKRNATEVIVAYNLSDHTSNIVVH